MGLEAASIAGIVEDSWIVGGTDGQPRWNPPPGVDHVLRSRERGFSVGIRKVAEMTVEKAS
jgi:hypothetical protein